MLRRLKRREEGRSEEMAACGKEESAASAPDGVCGTKTEVEGKEREEGGGTRSQGRAWLLGENQGGERASAGVHGQIMETGEGASKGESGRDRAH